MDTQGYKQSLCQSVKVPLISESGETEQGMLQERYE